MPRRLLCAALLATVWTCGTHTATAVEWTNCDDPYYRSLDLAPAGPGPLELARVSLPARRVCPQDAASVSPDGGALAYLETGYSYVEERKVLHVAPLHVRNTSNRVSPEPRRVVAIQLGPSHVPAFAWASDSSAIWTATREKVGPEGIAKSGLQPALTAGTGNLEPAAPLLRHEAGPLDGLLWADGDGLAIAHFGARGETYLPQRLDRAPTFAIVDARRGLVLDTLAFGAIEANKRAGSYHMANFNNAAVTKLKNGKVRALLSTHSEWTLWTQGAAPRRLVDPYPEQRHGNRLTISPDGSRVLVGRQLVCEAGVADSDNAGQRRTAFQVQNCKPVVESDIAALHDLETGRQIWKIRAAVNRPSQVGVPAISDDGRYALVALPPDQPRSPIALVSMNDGKVVQTLPSPGESLNSMGFLPRAYGVDTQPRPDGGL